MENRNLENELKAARDLKINYELQLAEAKNDLERAKLEKNPLKASELEEDLHHFQKKVWKADQLIEDLENLMIGAGSKDEKPTRGI